MFYVVNAIFKPGVDDKTGSLNMAFNDHLMQKTPRIHLGGALHDEQGVHVGVFFVIEAASFDQVRELTASSAYTKAGMYDRVDVSRLDLEIGHLV